MRRAGLLLALVFGAGGTAAAQSPRVGLVVSLMPSATPGTGREPLVRVTNLLRDERWSEALDQAFPIRLAFKVEIWRSREGWIDEFQRATEWSMVIQREPLEEQYRVTTILLAGTTESRFPTRAELERYMATPRSVEVLPRGVGSFYYTVRLRITALTDEDMDELEQFLAGQPNAQRERSPLARSLRRLLLRMAGLPWEELEMRTEKFSIGGTPE